MTRAGRFDAYYNNARVPMFWNGIGDANFSGYLWSQTTYFTKSGSGALSFNTQQFLSSDLAFNGGLTTLGFRPPTRPCPPQHGLERQPGGEHDVELLQPVGERRHVGPARQQHADGRLAELGQLPGTWAAPSPHCATGHKLHPECVDR